MGCKPLILRNSRNSYINPKYHLKKSSMEDYKIMHEIKRHAVIIAKCAKNTDLDISNFLSWARSFVHKVRRELKASAGNKQGGNKQHEERSVTTKNTQFPCLFLDVENI